MKMEDPETMLTDPNLWISDIGATVHSTAKIAYTNNLEPDTSNTVVVMGNGKKLPKSEKSKEFPRIRME
jgi:hypothetical protein